MLYVSLTGPLLGVFIPVPSDDEEEARMMLATSKLKSLWCSVYTLEAVRAQVEKYGGVILDSSFAEKLDYDAFLVNRVYKMRIVEG